MTDTLRKVAIIGGARIPFARSNTAYAEIGNQEMLVAALTALVSKFNLKGELVGEVGDQKLRDYFFKHEMAEEVQQAIERFAKVPSSGPMLSRI